MTKATLSDAVKTLIKKELVMKEVSQEDSRLFYIMLTAKGKLLAGEVSFFADGIADQIKNLPKEKKELMLEMLLELIDKLHQAGIITLTRMCFTCTHYANKNDGHYCTLLNNPMETVELRIHCTEHQSPLPAVLNLEQS